MQTPDRRSLLVPTAAALLAIAVTASSAPARTCEVVLRLDDEVVLGSLQFRIGYAEASGAFAGEGVDVECTSPVPNTITEFFHETDTQELNAGFITSTGIHGPRQIARCTFVDDEETAAPDQFTVEVLAAGDLEGEAVPSPTISLRLPDCDPELATSTTTTTSTSTSTTLLEPQTTCDLTFRILTAATIGSLDWEVLYTNAFGEFRGEAGDVDCTNLRPATIVNFNDRDTQRRLLSGLISLSGFATPADIARCTFVPSGIDEPIASDFQVVVRAATDPNVEFIDPTPTMVISSLECVTPEFALCGDADQNGFVQAADALRILKNAVGQPITCPLWVCDTDNNAQVQASDALRTLRRAVGQSVALTCPPRPA